MTELVIKTAKVFAPLLEPARYKGAYGGRGCVHADTLIDTPKGQVRIKDFKGGRIYAVNNGIVIEAMATSPLEYSEEQLYEVCLSTGQKIVCTDEHRFLTARGWVELQHLSTCDVFVVAHGQEPASHSPSILGSILSVLRANVRHCWQTLAGCLDGYLLCLHRYDRQPLAASNIGLFSTQQQGDAPPRMIHASFHAGDLVCVRSDNPSSASRHPSNHGDAVGVEGKCCAMAGSRIAGKVFESLLAFSQLSPLFLPKKGRIARARQRVERAPGRGTRQGLAKSLQKQLHRLVDTALCNHPYYPFAKAGDVTTLSKLSYVRKHSRQKYWDLHVYGVNNYLSNGIVNHNSGKSHFFGELLIEDSLREPGENGGEGLRSVCIREVQKDLAQSSKLLIESKLRTMGLTEADGFKVYNDLIQTPRDGLIIFKGMNNYTADSIKSLEGFKRAWWEESHTATSHSLNMLRPTIRSAGSQLWFSWNPRFATDPVDLMLRGEEKPTGSAIVNANWRDNPYFTDELEQERIDCLRMQADQYDHIWEGGYVTVAAGAYFAKDISEARLAGRIGKVSPDPLMTIRLFCDIGGTGARADAFSMWAAQFIGREIRVLKYYEAIGQPLAAHLAWMREQGYTPDKAQIWLPHDGDTQDKVFDVSYRSALEQAGYKVEVVPNQGKGAAKQRVEAVRRLFPSMWIDEQACSGGLTALGWYHEKRDDIRNIGLGPEHDWASHASDAFGLMAIAYSPSDGWGDYFTAKGEPKANQYSRAQKLKTVNREWVV